MIRTLFILSLIVIEISRIDPPPVWGETRPSKEQIIGYYLKNAARMHQMKGSVQLQCQRLYWQELSEPLKAEIEKVYALPRRDPFYRKNTNPILRSFSQITWDAILDGTKMSGTQRCTNSNTKFLERPRPQRSQDGKVLLQLDLQPGLEFPFTLHPGPMDENRVLQLVLPKPVAYWHYLPNLWYPKAKEMGLPDDFNAIKLRWNGSEPIALIFQPASMPVEMLAHLRYLSNNAKLSLDDLTAILTIDPMMYVCKSFSINVKESRKLEPLFNIDNSNFDPDQYAVPIPRMSIIYTSWSYYKGERPAWSCNYFAQFNQISFAGI